MKQQLWILNSALLFLFIFTFFVGMLLKQTPSRFRERKPYTEERQIRKELSAESVANIYKYDLFGTFAKAEAAPSLKSLVTPIPKPRPATVPKPPEPPKPTFLPPLKLTVNGIAFSYNEEKSICMIVDEKKKEEIYHVGDTIKDAQVIKISKNRITLLRTNGQHETVYLRKEDLKKPLPPDKQWSDVVKKIDNTTFEIDLAQFPKEIPTLGNLIETLSLLTEYDAGKPTGVKIASLAPNNIGIALGLKANDLITDINGIKTAEPKNRITIYDNLTRAKLGDDVKISLKRGTKNIAYTYKLTAIEKIEKKEFAPKAAVKADGKAPAAAPGKPGAKAEETLFKLNKLQEREKKRRDFAKKHGGRQQQAVDEIRNRLLQDIRASVRNTRTR